MKNKIILTLGIVVLAGANFYLSSPSDVSLNKITFSNIEALAQYEGSHIANMRLEKNMQTLCKVCVTGGMSCAVSSQCCQSWGSCWM